MYERDQFTMTIPEVASEENQDIPHIIQLRINEELCHCLVDTGPEDGKWNINWTAIVCDNETLGNVRAILGRDFLHASQACISYENEPFVKLKGEIFRFLCQEGPTCDSGYHDKNIGHITTSLGVNRNSEYIESMEFVRRREIYTLPTTYQGDAERNLTHERKHSRRSNGSSGKFFEERHKSDIEEWKMASKIKSFFGSSRNGKPTEELQHTNDVNRQPNQEYGKDSAESIEGKIEEVVVTEIQTETGKEDAGEQIEGKDSVPEPVEQEIQENKDLVEPSLEMISTEKQPRDPEEVFHDITSIDTTKSAGCSSDQEQKWETDIVLEEDIIIPARTEALVNAKLSTIIEGELVVCEPVDIGNGYVHAANCLMVNSTKAWIRVVNVSQKEVKLMKKHKLAKAVSYDEEWSKRGFSLEHLDEDTREKLMALIRGYHDLFLEDDVVLTSATEVKHSITLEPGAQPICKAPYRIPYHQREVLQKEIDRLLDTAVIRPSGYNSGSEALFSVIDVAEAYHQIDMEEKDIPLTGFSTFQGHYEYLKMPFGLVNAPSTFQRFMNITLAGLTGELCMEVIKLVKEEDAQEASYYLSKDGILYRVENDGDKLIVPKTFIPKVMEDFHDSPMAGHPGQQKTLMSLKRRFFWPNMRTDVIKLHSTLHSTTEPWELTSMDVVGPLVTSLNGNRYLLTFQDYFTKTLNIASCEEGSIVRHGSPKKLLTDRGANFTSTLFKEVCKVLGIEKLQTASYAPTTNGQIERMHRVLKDMLSHYISENQRDWDNWIPFVLMAYRGSTHSSTGYSPYFLLHGRDQVLPMDSMISSGRIRYDYDDNYTSELLERLRRVYSDVYKNTEKAKSERVKRYNKKTEEHKFNMGDQVYLKDMAVKRGLSKKLVRSWIGPYRIIEMIGPVTCRIRKCGGRDEQIVHVNRLKIYTARTDEEHR
ncbi:hypothetical protein JTB14_023549 [Gonioctena quinquepunctata]|nr:hypothetical protein JTB14_023549 [Gonioctena quinquepunctata]